MGACLLAASLLLPGAAHAAGSVTLVLHQAPFEVAQHDLDGNGIGPGDLYTWIAPVTAADGRTGIVVGEHVTVVTPTTGPFAEVRIGTSAIDLGNGDSVALGGLIPVAVGPVTAGVEIVNAIIGGTGAFTGAKGEIRSIRAGDGSWTHRLSYQTADLARPGRTIRATSPHSSELVDVTGDGKIGPGDFRVFHFVGTTEDGRPAEARGSQVVVRGAGEAGSLVQAFGYAVFVVDGAQIAALARPRVQEGGGQLGGGLAIPLIGGTGQYAGVSGAWIVESLGGGSVKYTFTLFPAPTAGVDRTVVMRSALPQVRNSSAGGPGGLGKKFTFSLPFIGVDGESGVAFGYGSTVAPARDGSPVRTIMGLISVQFDDGSTVLIGNVHTENAEVPSAAEFAVTRPVLGGTGRYAGVSGELVSTLDGGGGLIHTFKLRGPAASQPPVPRARNTGRSSKGQ